MPTETEIKQNEETDKPKNEPVELTPEEKAQAVADAREFHNCIYEGGSSSPFIWC